MQKYKLLFTTAAALTAAAVFSINSKAISAGEVATQYSPLTVRSQSSTSSSKLALLPQNSIITLISKSGSWWYVEYANGKYGYCHADYIEQLSLNEAYVDISGGRLNVRSAAALSASIKDKLNKGEAVVVLSKSGNWSRILYNGNETGYVYSDYLSENKQSSDNGQSIYLSVPDYKQYDSRWADLKIGSSNKTMRSIGCVTAALAATESYRTGDSSLTPAKMLYKLSYNSSGDVSWPSNYQKYTSGGYLDKTYQLLKQGKPVIFGAKNGYGKMHWVVVNGYKGSGALKSSDFLINDPGSETRATLADLFKEYPNFYKIEYYV